MLFSVSILATLMLLYGLYKWLNTLPKLQMPGPKGWPFIGHVLLIDPKAPHVTFTEWSHKFGPVLCFRLLQENWVVVSSLEAIHEVLVTRGEEFAGRPQYYRLTIFYGDYGFSTVSSSTPRWKPIRTFTHKGFKQFSTGMLQLEAVMSELSQEAIVSLGKRGEEPFDPQEDIYNFLLKGLLFFIMGDRVKDDSDPRFQLVKKIQRLTLENMSFCGRGAELDVFPWLHYFGNTTYRNLLSVRQLIEVVWKMYAPHLKSKYDPQNPSCVMDLAFHEMDKVVDSGKKALLDETNLQALLAELLVSGLNTTLHSLLAFINILVHYPDVMHQLYSEVDTVVGRDRKVTLADKENMPYTRACILELLRYSSIAPVALPHSAQRDTQVCGLAVPQGTHVMVNLWALHHDQDYWQDPWTFCPERFLDSDGNVVPADHGNRRHLMAFGAGTRVCVGEIFARTRLFLFITTLVQQFDIKAGSEDAQPPCDPRTYSAELLLKPQEYTIKLISRQL